MKIELVNIRQLPWINRGIVYQITDLLTGLKYNIVGEHNSQRHADYVCSTRVDTDIKLRTANNNFNNNWTARPVILTIGDRHFAASTHNAAHPPDMTRWRNPRDIGHNGHFCVWVLEATTSGSEAYRRSMLAAVHQAYEMATRLSENNQEVEEVTQERFNQLMDGYLASRAEIAEPSDWAVAELADARDSGITDGTRPHGFVTRQEAAIMALRGKNACKCL